MIDKSHTLAPTGAATFLITAGINLAKLGIEPIASSLAIYSAIAIIISFGFVVLLKFTKEEFEE